jgi:hypothetical protein
MPIRIQHVLSMRIWIQIYSTAEINIYILLGTPEAWAENEE